MTYKNYITEQDRQNQCFQIDMIANHDYVPTLERGNEQLKPNKVFRLKG